MTKIVQRIGITALLAGLLLTAGFWLTRQTVTLTVDGQPRQIKTRAFRVSDVLREQGIIIGQGDLLTPKADSWLWGVDAIQWERAIPIQIWVDAAPHNLLTPEKIPANLLALAKITLRPGDELLSQEIPIPFDEPLPYAAAHSLQVRRAITFTLQTEGSTQILSSTAATLGQALWEADIHLRAADRLIPTADTPLKAGLQASLKRARSLTVQIGAQGIDLQSAATTVGEALREAGLAPQGMDYSLPAEDAAIPADGLIRLVRVSEAVQVEQQPLPFETLTQISSEVPLDSQRLLQPGKYGLQAQRVRLRYEDGVEITRTVESAWMALTPEAEIIGYGSQVSEQALETPDGTVSYYRALQFWATSYNPSAAGGTTATGQPVRRGLVATDWNYLPPGTQLYIPGYGFAEVADTGRISGRWIDLGYSDNDYVAWHGWVTVYFLWPPPAYIPPVIPPPSHY